MNNVNSMEVNVASKHHYRKLAIEGVNMKNDKKPSIHDYIFSVCMIALTLPCSLFMLFCLIAAIAKILTKGGETTMTLREEMKKVQEEGKIFIPPYKLNEMMKVAGKIVKILTDNAHPVGFSYDDMRIIMKIVDHTIDEHTQPQDQEGD